jgi:phytoene dehydrogenase-like protein
MNKPNILIVGAGINGLVAANYLRRAGFGVTMIERSERVGGACVSETANVDGITQHYALGASVLGLMQDFVFEETGLSSGLQTFVPEHAKFVHFPGDKEPTWIYRDRKWAGLVERSVFCVHAANDGSRFYFWRLLWFC